MTVATGTGNEHVTVVVTSRVHEGRHDDFRRWQASLNDAAATFDGFVEAEVVPPVQDLQDQWTTIYRFDSADHLATWMSSPERHRFLEAGTELFDAVPRELAMAGGALVDPGYTLVIAHKVKPDKIDAFLRLQRDFDEEESAFPGYRGSELLRPVPGVTEEWTALVRFEDQSATEAWLHSPKRQEFIDKLETLVDGYEIREVDSSFGGWFNFDTKDGKPTPNWKQWLAVLLALYPTVMLLGLVTKWLPGGSKSSSFPPLHWFFVNLWMGNFLSTLLLSFLIMPIVSRALLFWLRPDAALRASILGTVLVIALYAVTVTIFGVACRGGC